MSSARGACHLESSEGDDRTTDREIWLLEWNGKGKERGEDENRGKEEIYSRTSGQERKEGGREGGKEGDRGRSDNAVHATGHMWRTEEGGKPRSFVRSSVLPLIYGPIRFCSKSGRAS